MGIVKLAVIFLVIILALKLKRPLYQAILLSILATAVLFLIHPLDCLKLIFKASTSWSTWSMLLIFYLITLLQRILESRDQLKLAQKDLNGLVGNRRVNASLAPAFIGLLPAAAAVLLCADIVEEACGPHMDKGEKAFVTSYFRHIPEAFLPTYSSIILMASLSGVSVGSFVVGMFPMILLLFFLGYVFYLRRLPKDTGDPPSENKGKDLINLVKHLWSLILIIILILGFGLPVYTAAAVVIALSVFIYKIRPEEAVPLLKKGFERKLLVSSFLIMVLREFLAHTGVINTLPRLFSGLPVPAFLIFALIFFFGTVVSGATAIIAICTTMAFSAIPGAGMPLMVLLTCFSYAAMQISPTHICLPVVTERFDIPLSDLVKRTIPVIGLFCLASVGYYLLLTVFF